MAEMNFLKKPARSPVAFLCILSTASAVPFGHKPAGAHYGGAVEIIAIDRTDFSSGSLMGPAAARPVKVEYLAPAHSPRPKFCQRDREPSIEGRDVDVSYAIAKQIGFAEKGIKRLDIESVSELMPRDVSSGKRARKEWVAPLEDRRFSAACCGALRQGWLDEQCKREKEESDHGTGRQG